METHYAEDFKKLGIGITNFYDDNRLYIVSCLVLGNSLIQYESLFLKEKTNGTFIFHYPLKKFKTFGICLQKSVH